MTDYPWTAWLWWIGGAVLGLLGLWLLYCSLLRDRSKGRRRCPKCWYNMSGTDSMTCSECGRTTKRDKKLYKTRRRWRWALLALLVYLAATGSALTPKVKRDEWWSLVSNRTLVWGLVFSGDAEDWIGQEVFERIRDQRFSHDELRSFFERCAHGDWFARPISDRWKVKYGDLIERIQFMLHRFYQADPDGLKTPNDALWELPAELQLATRDPWPGGVPLFIEARMNSWWPYPRGHRIDVTPRLPDSESVRLGGTLRGILLPLTEPQETTIEFDYTVSRAREWRPNPQVETVETGTKRVDVRIAGKIEDVLRPVRDTQLDEILEAELSYKLTRVDGKVRALMFDTRAMRSLDFEGIAFGVVIEFIFDSEVVASWPFWMMGGQSGGFGGRMSQYQGDFNRVRQTPSVDGWTLRVRSDPQIALRVIKADRYWEGEITIPFIIDDR